MFKSDKSSQSVHIFHISLNYEQHKTCFSAISSSDKNKAMSLANEEIIEYDLINNDIHINHLINLKMFFTQEFTTFILI